MYNLLNKYLQPTFNMSGMGGGGGIQMPSFSDGGNGGDQGGDGFGGDDDSGGQQGSLINGENSDGDGDDSELNGIFQMFNDPENDDGDGDNDNNNNNNRNPGDFDQAEVTAMENDIKTAIGNMQFPMNLLPENFDPNDRAQMQQVMSRGLQAAVGQSLNVVFKPVQMALKQMATQLNAQIDQRVQESRNNIRDAGILESVVPEVNDSRYSSMISSMDTALASKGKKPRERADAIRKLLNTMGIKNSAQSGSNRRMSGGGDNGGGNGRTQRTGHAALDSFFGKFNFNPGGNGNGNGNGNGGRQQNGGGQNRR